MTDNDIKIQLERYFIDPDRNIFLRLNYKGIVCLNLRKALRKLNYNISEKTDYDNELMEAVRKFQIDYDHEFQDGLFGPGTRRKIVDVLFDFYKQEILEITKDFLMPERHAPSVFISYAWKDKETINKFDQWLRDNGIIVKRDIFDFVPGRKLPDEIERAIIESDKVLIFHSKNSVHRDWVRFETTTAERKEKGENKSHIIYVVLDNTPLPEYDSGRISIQAQRKKLKEVGDEILLGILGKKKALPRYDYDENEII